MPRPPTFRPTKRGKSWYLYVPDRGVVDLGPVTKDAADKAATRERNSWTARKAKTSDAPPPPAKVETPPQGASAEPRSMLSTWAANAPAPEPTTVPEAAPAPAVPDAAPVQSATPAPSTALVAPSTADRVNQIMPPDKRKKMADLLAKLAVRADILLLGATVRVFGRVPSDNIDPEEKEVLTEGVSMMLDDLFINTPPAPWMVAVGASFAIGLGMYADGTPIPKKDKLAPPATPLRMVEDDEPSA